LFANNCFTKFPPIHELGTVAPAESHGIEHRRCLRRSKSWEEEEEKHYAEQR
jgi:hypothetical protein